MKASKKNYNFKIINFNNKIQSKNQITHHWNKKSNNIRKINMIMKVSIKY